jgi:hypothetical protein
MLGEFQLGDGLAVHLVRAVGKAKRAGMGERHGQMEILADAAPAANLDRAVKHLLRDIWGDHLDHRDLSAGGFVADGIHHLRGVHGEKACLIDLYPRFRDPMSRYAVVRDRLAERLAGERPPA